MYSFSSRPSHHVIVLEGAREGVCGPHGPRTTKSITCQAIGPSSTVFTPLTNTPRAQQPSGDGGVAYNASPHLRPTRACHCGRSASLAIVRPKPAAPTGGQCRAILNAGAAPSLMEGVYLMQSCCTPGGLPIAGNFARQSPLYPQLITSSMPGVLPRPTY